MSTSTAVSKIAQSVGASSEDVEKLLRSMIISGKAQHGAVVTDAELVIASSICATYNLNPMMKEIAIFQTGGKLQFTIPLDGWVKLLNRDPNFDGLDFNYEYGDDGKIISIESVIYMKNRSHPTRTREFMDECIAMGGPTWKKCPARMLRNKALGQGVRISCGVTEVIDDDEAYRINSNRGRERDITPEQSNFDKTACIEHMTQLMQECDTLSALDGACASIRNELEAKAVWKLVAADAVLLKREQQERINSSADVVEFDEETGEIAE